MTLLRHYVLHPLTAARQRLAVLLHINLTQTLLLLLIVLAALTYPELSESGLEKFRREIVVPVKPGNYIPQPCGEWRFLPDSQEQLQSVAQGMRQLPRDWQFLTSNHIHFPSCILLWGEGEAAEVMINPEIVQRSGQAAHFRITHRPLCSAAAQPYQTLYYPSVQLEWADISGEPHNRSYSGSDARQLQLALKILAGENVCGAEPEIN